MLRFLILGYFLRNIYNWRKTHQGNQSLLQNFWLEQSPSCLSFGAPIAIFLLSGGIFLFCLDSLSLSCRQQKSCYSGPVSYCVFLLGNNVGVCSMLCGGAMLLRPDVNIARSCSCSSSKIGQSCSPSWPPCPQSKLPQTVSGPAAWVQLPAGEVELWVLKWRGSQGGKALVQAQQLVGQQLNPTHHWQRCSWALIIL